MLGGAKIAVVIPAKNEECHIGTVLGCLPTWVDEVIVVDDGSTDRTGDIVRSSRRCTELIVHERSEGVGAAIKRGYQVALDRQVDVVAVMAGDDQMRPEELSEVVLPVVRGEVDYAKGNRLNHPLARQEMPRMRRLGTRLLGSLTGLVSGIRTRDAQCGYTAISRDMLQRLPLDSLYPRYGYPNDLLVMLGGLQARVGEPTVSPVYQGQASGIRVSRALFTHSWVLLRAVLLRRTRKRFTDSHVLSFHSVDKEGGQELTLRDTR